MPALVKKKAACCYVDLNVKVFEENFEVIQGVSNVSGNWMVMDSVGERYPNFRLSFSVINE